MIDLRFFFQRNFEILSHQAFACTLISCCSIVNDPREACLAIQTALFSDSLSIIPHPHPFVKRFFKSFFNFFAVFFTDPLVVSLHIIALLFLFVNSFFKSFFDLEIQASLYKGRALFLCSLTNTPALPIPPQPPLNFSVPIHSYLKVILMIPTENSSKIVIIPFTIVRKCGILLSVKITERQMR